MKKILVGLWLMGCFIRNGQGLAACPEKGKMFLAWGSENASFLSNDGQEYAISLPRTADFTMQVGLVPTASTSSILLEIWPAIRDEEQNSIFTIKDPTSGRTWSFRIASIERVPQTDSGLLLRGQLLGGGEGPKDMVGRVIVASQNLPRIERVADLQIFFTDTIRNVVQGHSEEAKDTLIRSEILMRVGIMNESLMNSRLPFRIRPIKIDVLEGYSAEAFQNENSADTEGSRPKANGLVDANKYLENIIVGGNDGETKNREAVKFIKDKRREFGGDLVSIVTDAPLSFGDAAICGISRTDVSRPKAFSAVRWRCNDPSAGEINIAHEVGHNFGLLHDRYTVDPANADSLGGFSYGYVNTEAGFHTIMAYPLKCRARNVNCKIIRFYSTSDEDVRYERLPVGDANNNNARTLMQNFPTVANYFNPY